MKTLGHVYDPEFNITEGKRFSRITFGVGGRAKIITEKKMNGEIQTKNQLKIKICGLY